VGSTTLRLMGLVLVECLRCGTTRHAADTPMRHAHPECPRCGYLGWAPVESLTESEREALRTRPPERRRLRLA
jgi:hypothetical protein